MTAFTHPIAALCLAAAVAALVSCGGDGGSVAGVGTGGSGYAVGTVTGFGSVVVDGAAWNDGAAAARAEINPAAGSVAAAIKLGQRLLIEYETEPNARTIQVEAAAVGMVQSVDGSANPALLRVAGQTVRLNLDADAGPVTLLDGYPSPGAIAPGDFVEIHGAPRLLGGTYVLQASRVEKLTVLPGGLVRVQNVVQQFDAGGRTLRLGDLSVSVASTTVLPAGAAIANGKTVTVWGRPPAGALTTLDADFVRVRDLSANSKPSEISGTVNRLDATRRSFELAGVPVDAANAIVVPANLALVDGNFVVVRGEFRADGSLSATQVRIRKKGVPGFDHEVSLAGPITDFVSLARFRVRGVTVDGSTAVQRACNNVLLGNGVNVEIGGAIAGDKVVAELLFCR